MTTGTKVGAIIAVATLAFGMAMTPAQAATTKFTSCDKMHRIYKYGISKDKKAQTRAIREGMYTPPVKPQVYADSYKTLDRDKDGTMCEVPKS